MPNVFAQIQGTDHGNQSRDELGPIARRTHLITIIKGGDFFELQRAAEELSVIGELDMSARRALLELITRGAKGSIAFQTRRLPDALAAGGKAGVPDVVEALKSAEVSEREWQCLVAVLGRFGPPAKDAIPFLRKKLGDPHVTARAKASMRVVLANVGEASNENLRRILSDLRTPESCIHVVDTMISVRPGSWVTEEIIQELRKPFSTLTSKDRHGPVYDYLERYALLLGLVGEKAIAAASTLERAQKTAMAENSAVAVTFTLALARVTPREQDAVLRRLFTKRPRLLYDLDHTTIAVLSEDSYVLMDPQLSKCLARMLGDPARDVAEGAARMLWWGGLSGEAGFRSVLQYARGKAETSRRAAAASVLGRIARFSRLPELEAALKDEKAEEVRKQLKRAIDDIRLSGGKTGQSWFLERYPFYSSDRTRD